MSINSGCSEKLLRSVLIRLTPQCKIKDKMSTTDVSTLTHYFFKGDRRRLLAAIGSLWKTIYRSALHVSKYNRSQRLAVSGDTALIEMPVVRCASLRMAVYLRVGGGSLRHRCTLAEFKRPWDDGFGLICHESCTVLYDWSKSEKTDTYKP